MKILYLITEDWYFCSHRLPLASSARDSGYEVVVATRVQNHGSQIQESNLILSPISMRRRSKNPLSELKTIVELIKLYRYEQPDLVHHVALKPVLYGSIAALVTKTPVCVNAIAGLGFVFSSRNWRAKLLKPVIRLLFRILLNRAHSSVILQNPDDCKMLVNAGILEADHVALIRGSGVDLRQFSVEAEPSGLPVVLLASRMLWDKGVGEFVAAVKRLRREGVQARFVLVGDGDRDNPASISDSQLHQWQDDGVIEWWGRRDNMPEVLAQAHIVCLPSYREGLPKVLLEAAACGRPIVTTDAPGCREIVRDGENGLLVPVCDEVALAQAIKRLIDNPKLRKQMGLQGREIVEREFSLEQVIEETLSLYRKLLKK